MKKNRYNPYQTLMNYKWQIRATCTYKINVLAGKWVFPFFLYIEVQVQILIIRQNSYFQIDFFLNIICHIHSVTYNLFDTIIGINFSLSTKTFSNILHTRIILPQNQSFTYFIICGHQILDMYLEDKHLQQCLQSKSYKYTGEQNNVTNTKDKEDATIYCSG